ncbi:basic salivary proline-rich protein 4-like [Desmodus rotundus]|uniref:basic salivary proline-rich protein 4-like n=1 Tax=Desmodus rotundus TaxID=9430 RepID=UPI0039E5BE73
MGSLSGHPSALSPAPASRRLLLPPPPPGLPQRCAPLTNQLRPAGSPPPRRAVRAWTWAGGWWRVGHHPPPPPHPHLPLRAHGPGGRLPSSRSSSLSFPLPSVRSERRRGVQPPHPPLPLAAAPKREKVAQDAAQTPGSEGVGKRGGGIWHERFDAPSQSTVVPTGRGRGREQGRGRAEPPPAFVDLRTPLPGGHPHSPGTTTYGTGGPGPGCGLGRSEAAAGEAAADGYKPPLGACESPDISLCPPPPPPSHPPSIWDAGGGGAVGTAGWEGRGDPKPDHPGRRGIAPKVFFYCSRVREGRKSGGGCHGGLTIWRADLDL